MKKLIVISFYQDRTPEYLYRLLNCLLPYKDDILVVMNEASGRAALSGLGDITLLSNPNIGMNIGAWDRGFREFPDKDLYIFLQDECFLKQKGFLEAIVKRFESDKSLGMLGESLNLKWKNSWSSLRQSGFNCLAEDHFIDGIPARRVDCYLEQMKSWGIAPGNSGTHLRSLVWSFPGEVLRRLGGFPLGKNRGECIAAEIAVARAVVSLGYKFDQISEVPFYYFGHSEWRSDGVSKVTA